MRNYCRVILGVLVLIYCSTASLVVGQVDTVDEYIQSEMEKRQIPGLALAVLKNEELIKLKGYGFANIEHQAAVTPNTIFQSGSIGKQFTATAVMLLVEEGKLRLDAPLRSYISHTPEHWKDITIRHLLSHTSGIKNYTADSTSGINFHQDYTEDELLEKAKAMPLDFQPGEQWSYSNTGYVLLGILIGKVTGRFYGELLRERVFAPLEMETARVINEADIIPHRAAGYRLVEGELKNKTWVSPSLNTTADGSLYLTVKDLAKWDAALYTDTILEKSSLKEMWTPVQLNNGESHPYGLGWHVSEIRGHAVIQHTGSWQGFNSHIARYVDDGLTVIVLTNLAGANRGRIANRVAGLYVPELTPPIQDEN